MDHMEQAFTRKVKIEKLLTNGVIQEDIQEIKDSYARQEFMQAANVLKQILRENDEHHRNFDGYCERKGGVRMGEIFNVIPFIGKRGTGKTSTMLSFAHMLASFNPARQEYVSLLAEEGNSPGACWKNRKFVVLQYIDAGILKNKEDIMAIILARMLKYVRKAADRGSYSEYGMQAVRQEELRQLYQSFDRVYSDLLNLTQGEQFPAGESALRRLQNLNSSHSLSEEFQELVQSFLHFLRHNDESQCEYYFVISLDDIDMFEMTAYFHERKKDTYTILGQVYEYLQIPDVIVLTTFDETRLVGTCATHIESAFPGLGERECISQAIQYIQKVILPKYKIYMPSLSYEDYSEKWQLNIDVSEGSDLEIVLFPNGRSKEEKVKPKQLILMYLANVYGCYFDSAGKKQHFFEERTLRRIKNLFLALRTENGVPYSEVDEERQEQRYMHLLSYIYNQFIGEKLANSEENILFRDWLSMPIGRRSKEILGYIRAGRSKLDVESPHYYDYGITRDEGTYSYGELAHNLYHSSRCGIFSREMVHCILASYSLVLSRLYWRCISKNNEVAARAFGSLRSVLGTSISGRWSNEILYTTFVSRDAVTNIVRAAQIGSVSTRECDEALKISISNKWMQAMNCFLFKEDDQENKKSFQEFLHIVELLGMFFTNVRRTEREEQGEWKRADYGFQIMFIQEESETENPAKEIILNNQIELTALFSRKIYLVPQSKYACFNILNFVVNSFTWEEYFETLHSSLLEAMLAWNKQDESNNHFVDDSPENRKELMRRIKEYSLENEFESWANTYGRCAIPFQHFDMTYNILKRQRDAIDHGLPGQANVSEFYIWCGNVYKNISSALGTQDGFYQGHCNPKFKDVFDMNPFINVFEPLPKDIDKDKTKEIQKFRMFLADLAKDLVREEYTRENDFFAS